MSTSICILPILITLSTIGNSYNTQTFDKKWIGYNDRQKRLISNYIPLTVSSNFFTEQESLFCTSTNRDYINYFLTNHQIAAELTAPCDPQPLTQYAYVTSILKFANHWTSQGTYTRIESKENHPSLAAKTYAALTLFTDFHVFNIKNHDGICRPMFIIETQEGDIVYITLADKCLTDFDLLEKTMILSHQAKNSTPVHYTSLTIPMISLTHTKDIVWMQGLHLKDCGIRIAHMLQHITLQMDEYGFAREGFINPTKQFKYSDQDDTNYIIDKPFYFWIKRTGSVMPIFAAYIDEQDWKDPNVPAL